MGKDEMTYVDMGFCSRSQDRKTQRSQNNESKEMTKEEMTYMDMRFCSSSQERRSQRSQNSEKDQRPQNSESKDSPAPSSAWKFIGVILGILCLIILGTVLLLVFLWDKTNPCPKKWNHHGHVCYLFTTDWKSWQESKDYCTSLDSKLLDIKNKEELEFCKSLAHVPHWIGLSRQEGNETWLWEDGTALSKDLFAVAQENIPGCCVLLSKVEAKCISCEEPFSWICKKKAVHPEPAALIEGKKKSH
ncbi:natural killer cells antigen CD94-like [Alligator sinensis]|uniref:Natural killer cells antigen CD94-like n=1 Tax=Alligator sinensis TaxID=38654 RepID=A0A3Q0H9Y8_ALLSI|nr:natural killer cells antigen CD94-like [Alligator sinensis]